MSLPGVDFAARDEFRSQVRSELDAGNPQTQAVFDDWRAHIERYHGEVLTDAVSATDLFVDALTFDAAVRALQRAIETAFDVTVTTPPDSVDRRPVHDAVEMSLATDRTPARQEFRRADTDELRTLYERTVPASSRRLFGEYYTPPGLAELGVDEVATRVDEFDAATVLDPGCGAGAFLTAALRKKCPGVVEGNPTESGVELGTRRTTATDALTRLTDTVVGIDVNPVAVGAARAAYLLTLLPLVQQADADTVSIPVYHGDALGVGPDPIQTGVEGTADALVGNPPWIPWDRLPERQKRTLRDGPIERLSLFEHRGATARLGHANDDLSLPFVWTCLDRYLADEGVAAFVLKRDHLGGPAGRLLRSGRVGTRPLAIAHVHDFAAVAPFEGVDAAAALFVFRMGTAQTGGDGHRPTPTTVWEQRAQDGRYESREAIETTHERSETALVPVNADDPRGPWQRVDAERRALGECAYRIRHGLKDDAKAVFSVDADLLSRLEPTHVYPYLRSKHVVKWGLFGHDRFLVPQRQAGADNEAALRRETPATYAYLTENREALEKRGSSWFDDGPFYSLFGLGPYTWSPYKVVWCRLGFKPHFAVVSTIDDAVLGEKSVVPGDHCMFISCADEREAHYLCALLNAAPYQATLRDLTGEGKASLSKSTVSSLALPEWEATEEQQRLAELSQRAHGIVPEYTDRSKRAYNRLSIPALERVEREVDRTVARLLTERT